MSRRYQRQMRDRQIFYEGSDKSQEQKPNKMYVLITLTKVSVVLAR